MTLRWGIVTAGTISHDFVNAVNSYPDKGDIVIAAVAARNKSSAEEFAKLHKIPKVFESYKAMATSNAIDIAYIGSLVTNHYEQSKMFLENGKHVVCEKPLCINYKQAQSLIKFAKQKKLFFMEALWSRFSPAYKVLDKEIKDGKLGEIQLVEVNFGQPLSNIERLIKKSLGGGATLDIGIYALDFSQFIYKDEPIRVTAVGELNADGVDMVDTVVLEYTGGRRAVLNFNTKMFLWNKATVTGTKGRITLEDPFHFSLRLIHVDGQEQSFELHPSPLPYKCINSAGLIYEALDVTKCVKAGLTESPYMTHNDSLILAKLETIVRQQIGVHYDDDDKEFP